MTGNNDETKAVLEALKQKGVNATVVHEFAQNHIKEIVLKLEPGTRYSKFVDQAGAIANALGVDASELRMDAPIPGSDHVGIEYPNRDFDPFAISLDDPCHDSIYHKTRVEEWSCKLAVIAGKRVDGMIESFDLSSMPHLIVGGSCDKEGVDRFLDTTITGWISSLTPEQVQFILVDSEDRAFGKYADIPHLVVPPIEDRRKIVFASHWLVAEMEKRLKMFARAKVRNIHDFNGERTHAKPDMFGDCTYGVDDLPATVPYIVMVIRDYSCLKGVEKDVVCNLVRIAALGRAAGIHLVVATRGKSPKVPLTLLANSPGRIAFKAASPKESRMLIDDTGAENLLGGGDCLYRGKDGTLVRLQAPSCFSGHSKEAAAKPVADKAEGEEYGREYRLALETVIKTQRAACSHLQRKMGIGYKKASRLIELLQLNGVIGKDFKDLFGYEVLLKELPKTSPGDVSLNVSCAPGDLETLAAAAQKRSKPIEDLASELLHEAIGKL